MTRKTKTALRAAGLATAVVFGATASAEACIDGKSYTGGVRTPAMDWFCQTGSAGDTVANDGLDDWDRRVTIGDTEEPVSPGATGVDRRISDLEDEINWRKRQIIVLALELADMDADMRKLNRQIDRLHQNPPEGYADTQPGPSVSDAERRYEQTEDDLYEQKRRLETRIDSYEHDLWRFQREVRKLAEQIRQVQANAAAESGGGDLVTSQMNAPDTLFVDGMSWTWWTSGALGGTDESGAARDTNVTSASFLIGLAANPTADTGVSFGVGYARSHTDETDALGGGTIDGNTFKSTLTGFVTSATGLTFDATGAFDYSWNHRLRSATGITDDFTMHVVGLGAGVNGAIAVRPDLVFDWRLGYAGTWTTRHASVDSSGTAQGRFVSSLQRVSANGRFTWSLPDGSNVFAGAKLNAYLVDTTIAARAANPFDLELSAGGSFDIGGMSLALGGSVGGLGRAGATSWGVNASLTVPF